MTDDLVKRLRDFEQWMRDPEAQKFTLSSDLFDEAADRIEQLEAALQKISKAGDQAIPNSNLSKEAAGLWTCLAICVDIARAALAGEKKE